MMHNSQRWMVLATMSVIMLGCGGSGDGEMAMGPPITRATATLTPVFGSGVTGVVIFTQAAGGIKVEAHVNGLTPGVHGFHIHQFGDCSAPDATSAGGHFNPHDVSHGAPNSEQHHIGDLGNIMTTGMGADMAMDSNDESMSDPGHGMMMDQFFAGLSLTGPNSIIGRGLILHSGEDDLVSQPTGGAGSRVACGVIGVAKTL